MNKMILLILMQIPSGEIYSEKIPFENKTACDFAAEKSRKSLPLLLDLKGVAVACLPSGMVMEPSDD